MAGKLISKRQIAVPKRARKKKRKVAKQDRFEAARGKAQIKWKTSELLALLRG
jgi:hypothetical protein